MIKVISSAVKHKLERNSMDNHRIHKSRTKRRIAKYMSLQHDTKIKIKINAIITAEDLLAKYGTNFNSINKEIQKSVEAGELVKKDVNEIKLALSKLTKR